MADSERKTINAGDVIKYIDDLIYGDENIPLCIDAKRSLEKARNELLKYIPVKPKIVWICPNCGFWIEKSDSETITRCSCGQLIDWNSEEV